MGLPEIVFNMFDGVQAKTVQAYAPRQTQVGAKQKLTYFGEFGAKIGQAAYLASERIGGAVLDVTAVEPLPETSPLWDLPSCVITPHDSGFSPLSLQRTLGLFLDNLDRLRRGQPLLNEVRP